MSAPILMICLHFQLFLQINHWWQLFINEKSINFQIDTGASLTVMSRKIFENNYILYIFDILKGEKSLKEILKLSWYIWQILRFARCYQVLCFFVAMTIRFCILLLVFPWWSDGVLGLGVALVEEGQVVGEGPEAFKWEGFTYEQNIYFTHLVWPPATEGGLCLDTRAVHQYQVGIPKHF